ncbi:hypothetical protein LR48_Vigan10g239000 [Vigna angularis]|uniref:RING-type domain-containing protein n=1 Tax=Phaseolus angularis TaxID=3914 RepID=A0A0L9VNH6_PHAAN|nr:hypothetical protein LR48_Vigan10g239000 [Vigna angularis]
MCLLWYASTHHPDPHLPAKHVSDAGLSPSQLQKLPSITGKDLLMGSECAVCLDDIATDQPARLVPGCNHAFHVECAVGDSTAVWVSYSTVRPKDPILKVDLDVGMYLNDFMYVGFSWNGTVGAVAGVVTVGAFHPALFAGAFIWVYSKKGFSANRVIGHGAFGTLYKGVLPESGDTVAVKRCNHSGQVQESLASETPASNPLKRKLAMAADALTDNSLPASSDSGIKIIVRMRGLSRLWGFLLLLLHPGSNSRMLVARGGDNDISGGGSSSSKEASFPSLFLVRSRMEGKRFGGTVIMAKRLRGAREFHDKASSRHHYSCRFGDFDTVGGGLGLLLIRLGVRDLNGVLTGFGV